MKNGDHVIGLFQGMFERNTLTFNPGWDQQGEEVDSFTDIRALQQALRDAGFDDGEILEINQVTAYFAYANRTVLGLGINTAGDIIGLSPGDSSDPDNWSHS